MQVTPEMDAAEIIHEISRHPEKEKGKVLDFVQHIAQERFEAEQTRIAVQRLDDYDKGLEEAIPHEEAIRLLLEG